MNEIKTISIDIETFSSVDLQKSGVYKYSESLDFEILLFSYSINGNEEVKTIDLIKGEKIPDEILDTLTDEHVIKSAFNATFERICLSRYLSDLGVKPDPFYDNHPLSTKCSRYLNPKGWHCTMVHSATLGPPLSLEGVGAVLGLEKQKMTEGKALIKYFCVPCTPTKANGNRTRNMPTDDKQKWELFKAYNKRDVETEMGIQKKLSSFPVPEDIWEEYYLDQKINDQGIKLDMEFVEKAISLDEEVHEILSEKIKNITGVENPNSAMQIKYWLSENAIVTDSLDKKATLELIKTVPESIKEVLELRLQISKSSVKKYTAMKNAVCKDNRIRGMFQFYGANRTGRFSGKIVQLQNLPQNHISDLAEARGLIKTSDYDTVSMLYDDIPDTLSQLIRTALVPSKDNKFIVSDFSSIEARVLAWLSNEKWRLKAFEDGEDIYCSSASKMFGVPVVKHGINGDLRQKGKIAELALGYGGSVGALKAMGALDMGLSEEEFQPLVDAWRKANPNIAKLWWEVDRCVKDTVKNRNVNRLKNLKFSYESGFLFITLPSKRRLAYVKPRIGINKFGSESVNYYGIGSTKKWEVLESYGPKFVENIVQGVSRDILMYAINKLRTCTIVAHVHDEIIIDADKKMSLDAVCEQMGRTPPWADGLLLRADGYECEFYKKD